MTTYLLGIDTGGTFTDFVLYDGQRLHVHKRLSTPEAPARAILEGMAALGVPRDAVRVVHGSTVATNAVLEGKGVRTAYIANRGLADVLTIGRQARRQLYVLQPLAPPVPVPAELCLETGGRRGANGEVVEPLTDSDLDALVQQLRQLAPQAVAINLLYSFVDDGDERRIEARVPPEMFVSRSSAVLPEYREYERGIATWLNAWVGPRVADYLQHLAEHVPPEQLSVMQSSGDTVAASEATRMAVRMLLSGPAGGLAGARFVGELSARTHLLTIDMGGTSTDVALIAGEAHLTSEGTIAGYPVAVPMVDIHTIGAGGGSLARIDAGGLLQVGPQSAGADPGPACYGRGGQEATVTDANLVLGRLLPDRFLGGTMPLDVTAAHAAVGRCADALGLSIQATALGIVRLTNEHMAQALRVISVQRGEDPRRYTLLSFGGAGGLHVCALADALGIREALVPMHAGVLSALGMLVSPRGRQLSRTVNVKLDGDVHVNLTETLAQLESEARAGLRREGASDEDIVVRFSADLRYRGQSYTLNLPWALPTMLAAAFHERHEKRYGHRLQLPVELVNVRVSARTPVPRLELTWDDTTTSQPPLDHRHIYGAEAAVPVWRRDALSTTNAIAGPAIIADSVSTTFVESGWICHRDGWGTLLLARDGAA